MDALQVETYLNRIGITSLSDSPDVALRQLQLAHLYSVPFENLSIHWRQPMELDLAHLFEKIVLRKRGGFCYECNALFASLLQALGYEVEMLSARVAKSDGSYSPDFDHMLLLVNASERWIVDTGFGDSFRKPLRLDVRQVQHEPHREYQLIPDNDEYVLYQSLNGGTRKAQFKFSTSPRSISDFDPMFRFHRDSPDSHFHRAPLITLASTDGRTTLSDRKLIRSTLSGERSEQEVAPERYRQTLIDEFGLDGEYLQGNP
jgi:N-hydroxyarylamine O-acetyltransferase